MYGVERLLDDEVGVGHEEQAILILPPAHVLADSGRAYAQVVNAQRERLSLAGKRQADNLGFVALQSRSQLPAIELLGVRRDVAITQLVRFSHQPWLQPHAVKGDVDRLHTSGDDVDCGGMDGAELANRRRQVQGGDRRWRCGAELPRVVLAERVAIGVGYVAGDGDGVLGVRLQRKVEIDVGVKDKILDFFRLRADLNAVADRFGVHRGGKTDVDPMLVEWRDRARTRIGVHDSREGDGGEAGSGLSVQGGGAVGAARRVVDGEHVPGIQRQ